jgi:hypothetical protein
MSDNMPCELLAVLVADRVFREEGSRKVHIAGIFNTLNATSFPCLHPCLHIYVAFTDAKEGSHPAKVRFVYLDEAQTELLVAEGPVDVPDRLGVVEINFAFSNVLLPKPGLIAVEFWLDGVLVGSRKVSLLKTTPGGR